jgi:5-methylcytosine-specific restriction endonuclease McrA
MPRREFTKAVAVQIIKRATVNGQQYCEECGALAKRFEIDHVKPDGLEIDKSGKLTAEQGRLLCGPCHQDKTKADVANIAQAKRREARDLGAVRPSGKLQGRQFPKKQRPEKLPVPPARGMYR